MKRLTFILPVLFALFSCTDDERLYETNVEFPKHGWTQKDTASFEFTVPVPAEAYNLYCNVRNDLSFPWQRLFVNYTLQDSTGRVIGKDMIIGRISDKDGTPFGNSAIGDIYDHRFPMVKYQKLQPGKYTVKFQQMNRSDTLGGVLAVGLRVERAVSEP